MTSQPQTIIIITSRARAPVPQELQRGTERRRGERSNRSLSNYRVHPLPHHPLNQPISASPSLTTNNIPTFINNQTDQTKLKPTTEMQLPTTLLRRSIARPSFLPTITATTTTTRPFSLSPLNQARKDTQDKDSLKPEPTEYSKSGSDDAAAATEKAAFDPSSTRPEEEQNIAGRESGGDVSCLVILVTH